MIKKLGSKSKEKKINWRGLLFIAIPSAGLGWFIDQLLGLNNYCYLVSSILPLLMVWMYFDYLRPQSKPLIFKKHRHKIFSFIVFLFIGRIIFGAFALVFKIPLFDFEINNELYVVLLITTIFISVYGDKIVQRWFKATGFSQALENKDKFFKQSDVLTLIYFFYFVMILLINLDLTSETIELWINTFITYIAFERFWNHISKKDA